MPKYSKRATQLAALLMLQRVEDTLWSRIDLTLAPSIYRESPEYKAWGIVCDAKTALCEEMTNVNWFTLRYNLLDGYEA